MSFGSAVNGEDQLTLRMDTTDVYCGELPWPNLMAYAGFVSTLSLSLGRTMFVVDFCT